MIHRYVNNGYNIVLDVNSGSVHVVDEVTYDVIPLFEEIKAKSEEEIKQHILNVLKDKYNESDILESIDEVNTLYKEELLFTEDIYEKYITDFKSRKTALGYPIW